MSKIKGHTPGPWELVDAARPRIYHKEDVIATVEPDHVGKLACDRNARLIAAAPELYAALESLTQYVDSYRYNSAWAGRPHAIMDHARAAIARATGKGE